MSDTKVRVEGSQLLITAPYNEGFQVWIKKMGGRWISPHWVASVRDESAVRAKLKAYFGDDGTGDPADVLTIRTIPECAAVTGGAAAVVLAGRTVASVRGRDSGARTGANVAILKGGFASGGSMKNYKITWRPGTVFELRDVPASIARKIFGENEDVTLLDASGAIVAEPSAAAPVMPAEEPISIPKIFQITAENIENVNNCLRQDPSLRAQIQDALSILSELPRRPR